MFEKKLEAVLNIEGMHCNHCKAKVEATIKALKGIKSVEVSLESASAKVLYAEGKITPEKIAASVTESGFNASVK